MSENEFIPYGKQTIEEDDIEAVVAVLRENQFLTTGPRIKEFEDALCKLTGVREAIAVNSGTAALHACIRAIALEPGEEVIVPAISFAATANCVLYERGVPVFCDIEPETMNIDPDLIEGLITEKTRAIIAVDFAGQLADYGKLMEIASHNHLILIADAAHSIGLEQVGGLADLTACSFHPVKNMTTGEGGAVLTNNRNFARRARRFRNHGINIEYQDRIGYEYDIVELGYNYRITDIQCALGLSQIKKVKKWIARRQELAKIYDDAFKDLSKYFIPLTQECPGGYHLYVILLDLENLDADRDQIFMEIKSENIGVNVHYRPIYLLEHYQKNCPWVLTTPGLCPIAENVYERIITIPLFPTMTSEQQQRVIKTVRDVIVSHIKE